MEKEGKKHQFFIGSSHVQYICSCFCEKNLCYQESANFSVNNTLLPSITFLRSLSNVHAFLFSFLTCTFTFSFSLFYFSLVLSLFFFLPAQGLSPPRGQCSIHIFMFEGAQGQLWLLIWFMDKISCFLLTSLNLIHLWILHFGKVAKSCHFQ